jgi:Leucine-rich repeat (LRR) protein
MKTLNLALLLLAMAYSSNAQNVNIPDTAFLYALIDESVDTNGDSLISYAEAEAVTYLEFSYKIISDMTGIEAFINLDTLDCYHNQLTNLDVTNNTALTVLDCSSNQLTSLDVTNNTALTWLDCHGNKLTSLDFTNNTSLKYLECWGNLLSSLDVINNTALEYLNCSFNLLSSLDVMNNTALDILNCSHNKLTSLDVSNNAALYILDCSSNPLAGLDISNNITLESLDLSEMPTLYEVCVWITPFPPAGFSLNPYDSPNVYFATDCGYNNVFIPDTAFLYALIDEDVDANGDSLISYAEAEIVTNLDVSGNSISDMTGIEALVNLYCLYCHHNQLTNLDVSDNASLNYLACSDNQLTDLDISNNTTLTVLYCDLNQLTSLDVTNNTALEFLFCNGNQLTALDVINNTALKELHCSENQLTSLDISNNSELYYLDLSNMPTLYKVCVWEMPFPLADKVDQLDTTGSPNIYFTTDCADNIADEYSETRTTNIYPNPSDGIISIEIENINNATIEIYNVSGRLAYSRELNSKIEKIDISGLSEGMYFVKVGQEHNVSIDKLIVY